MAAPSTADNHWASRSLLSRISDPIQHRRHQAGSPNEAEIDTYSRYLLDSLQRADVPTKDARVVILGMTPELRERVHQLGCSVVCVDSNPAAIDLYRDWVAPQLRIRETILPCDWTGLADQVPRPINAILGDGILANTPNVAACQALLEVFARALAQGGSCIFRLSYLPERYLHRPSLADHFLRLFREGRLHPAEFGFGMRKLGFLPQAYDAATHVLDNSIVYQCVEEMYALGLIDNDEYKIVNNYYFSGPNLFMPEPLLKQIIINAGFTIDCFRLVGRDWYDYYSFYICTLASQR